MFKTVGSSLHYLSIFAYGSVHKTSRRTPEYLQGSVILRSWLPSAPVGFLVLNVTKPPTWIVGGGRGLWVHMRTEGGGSPVLTLQGLPVRKEDS